MNRSLRVERIYRLGDYQDIRFADEITDLPESVATDDSLITKLTVMQLLRIETGLLKYYKIRSKYQGMPIEDALAAIEAERSEVIESILSEFNKPKETI
jgi:hypothetical protein